MGATGRQMRKAARVAAASARWTTRGESRVTVDWSSMKPSDVVRALMGTEQARGRAVGYPLGWQWLSADLGYVVGVGGG